jgi:hypothetical protein
MAIAVTADGSFKLQRGTLAFTCIGLASGTQYTSANHVPGLISDHHLYHSELTGILGMVLLIKIVCQFFQSTSQQVTFGCDNLELGKHGLLFEKKAGKDCRRESHNFLIVRPVRIGHKTGDYLAPDPKKYFSQCSLDRSVHELDLFINQS